MTQLSWRQLKLNLKNSGQWIRLVYMMLFLALLYASIAIAGLLIFIQVLFVFITGSVNQHITRASADLIRYISQILLFLSYSDERKPFPCSPWGEREKPSVIKENTAYAEDKHEAMADTLPKK